jgi:hypothetical protein
MTPSAVGSCDGIVARQTEPRITNLPATYVAPSASYLSPAAAHFRLILRVYDRVYRQAVL